LFADALFATFPEWVELARLARDKRTGEDYIEVRVRQPGRDRELMLKTEGNRITMRYALRDTNIGPFLRLSLEESVRQSMNMLEEANATIQTCSSKGTFDAVTTRPEE
jgi:hypothetical protein